MSKKKSTFSLDEVLSNLQAQAEAEWEAVDDAGNVIGGTVAPTQASCHNATSSSGGSS
jgi:hypothetical protein